MMLINNFDGMDNRKHLWMVHIVVYLRGAVTTGLN